MLRPGQQTEDHPRRSPSDTIIRMNIYSVVYLCLMGGGVQPVFFLRAHPDLPNRSVPSPCRQPSKGVQGNSLRCNEGSAGAAVEPQVSGHRNTEPRRGDTRPRLICRPSGARMSFCRNLWLRGPTSRSPRSTTGYSLSPAARADTTTPGQQSAAVPAKPLQTEAHSHDQRKMSGMRRCDPGHR
jgi:hypothetical protein